MDFLKRLFGGGQAASSTSGDPDGLYFFVRPKGCEEVVRVRINRMNDLSEHDEGGYWVHKAVRGTTCFQGAELDVYFDANKRITRQEVSGGELVDQAAFDAWQKSRSPQS